MRKSNWDKISKDLRIPVWVADPTKSIKLEEAIGDAKRNPYRLYKVLHLLEEMMHNKIIKPEEKSRLSVIAQGSIEDLKLVESIIEVKVESIYER